MKYVVLVSPNFYVQKGQKRSQETQSNVRNAAEEGVAAEEEPLEDETTNDEAWEVGGQFRIRTRAGPSAVPPTHPGLSRICLVGDSSRASVDWPDLRSKILLDHRKKRRAPWDVCVCF